jgi:hypothetical protein
MKYRYFITLLIVGLLLFNSVFIPPALAGRYVLNQTPQTIESYFGRYTTKLTQGEQITYTYTPKSFRGLFPKFPKSNFAIIFVNNQAKYITLNFNGNFGANSQDYNYEQAEAAKFYNYIFGYKPPIWQEISDKFSGNETIHDYEYCLGDGVATSFQRYGYQQLTDAATLFYDTRCEPKSNRK